MGLKQRPSCGRYGCRAKPEQAAKGFETEAELFAQAWSWEAPDFTIEFGTDGDDDDRVIGEIEAFALTHKDGGILIITDQAHAHARAISFNDLNRSIRAEADVLGISWKTYREDLAAALREIALVRAEMRKAMKGAGA